MLREGSGGETYGGEGGNAIKCISPLPSRPLNTQFRLKGMSSENKQKSKVVSIDRYSRYSSSVEAGCTLIVA